MQIHLNPLHPAT
jgi:hypothetical protein